MDEDNPLDLDRCETGNLCDFHGRVIEYELITIRCFEYKYLCRHHQYLHEYQQAKRIADDKAEAEAEKEQLKRELQEYQWHNPPYQPQLPGRQKTDFYEGRCWDWIVVDGGFHYVRDQEYFESYTPLSKTTVRGTRVLGIGSVELTVLIDGPTQWLDESSNRTHTFILGNVLHIPTAYNNGFVADLVCDHTKIRQTGGDRKLLQGYDDGGEVVFSAENMYDNGSPLAEMVKRNPQLNVELTIGDWEILLKAENMDSDDEIVFEDDSMEAIEENLDLVNPHRNRDVTTKGLKRLAHDLEQQASDEDLKPAAENLVCVVGGLRLYEPNGDMKSPRAKRRKYRSEDENAELTTENWNVNIQRREWSLRTSISKIKLRKKEKGSND